MHQQKKTKTRAFRLWIRRDVEGNDHYFLLSGRETTNLEHNGEEKLQKEDRHVVRQSQYRQSHCFPRAR